MKIKTYKCESEYCGEDIYEDDKNCMGCNAVVDQSKFKVEDIPGIHDRDIKEGENEREANRPNRAATEEKVS